VSLLQLRTCGVSLSSYIPLESSAFHSNQQVLKPTVSFNTALNKKVYLFDKNRYDKIIMILLEVTMLTFNEKLTIIEKFPELERKDVSLKRVNFQLLNSVSDKKNIVYHLHPNGNGYVYAGHLNDYTTDDKGMVNIRDYSEEELNNLLEKAIQGLLPVQRSAAEQAIVGEQTEERWVNEGKDHLILINENDAWNIYYGLNLDASFDTYGEAEDFLKDEGFQRV
jgi:hypothetical protein